ncbi:fimbrial biogenesis chaperone [Frateuria defendens]|uniref:fimbrial biogenesis chaperone n=1 Tax=Frateuria defendens TaxID=2219559 RepID=UPI00066FFC52|nr:fimbria/pilus periplasmic chaperone [Frateuria defendens]
MKKIIRFLCFGALALAATSHASVVIDGTRVIYPAQQKEVDVRLHNTAKEPVVVQAWLDDGNPRKPPDAIHVPFVLMPPMARLDGGRSQVLRLVYTGEPLPGDKESVFWLNVLEIPPKSKPAPGTNTLQFAFRTRIKLFFRPDELPGTPAEAMEHLSWQWLPDGGHYVLEARNASVYHVSLGGVELLLGDKVMNVGDGMLAPGGSLRFTLQELHRPPPQSSVHYVAIDDYGAHREFDKTL